MAARPAAPRIAERTSLGMSGSLPDILVKVITFAALCVAMAADSPLNLPHTTAYVTEGISAVKRGDEGIELLNGSPALLWGGRLLDSGPLQIQLQMDASHGGQPLELKIKGPGVTQAWEINPSRIPRLDTLVKTPGWHRITLTPKNRKSMNSIGLVTGVTLTGQAAKGAQFNTKPRLNAASVHIGYPLKQGEQVNWFYTEVKALEDPVHTFYMACGFRRGYFGMQVNSPTERRIIFSVWDSGEEAMDREKVPDEDKVVLLGKGEGVVAHGFGSEGTGGHSHLKTLWKTGDRQRFLLKGTVRGDKTRYTGWWFSNEENAWKLIASFLAPKTRGMALNGLHSFSENFWGDTGHLLRAAEFGPVWVMGQEGVWRNLNTGVFTHDGTGGRDRFDYDLTARGERLMLQHGGFTGSSPLIRTRLKVKEDRNRPQIDLDVLTQQETVLTGPG